MRHVRSLPRVLALIGALAVTGCLTEVPNSRPATISLEVLSTAPTAGAPLRISFTAGGTGISAVNLDLGDGTLDERPYGGATSVTDFVDHTYTTAGTYTITAEVIAASGTASATLDLTVS